MCEYPGVPSLQSLGGGSKLGCRAEGRGHRVEGRGQRAEGKGWGSLQGRDRDGMTLSERDRTRLGTFWTWNLTPYR